MIIYWLSKSHKGDTDWKRVSKTKFMRAENDAGFRSKTPGTVATGSFGTTVDVEYPRGKTTTSRKQSKRRRSSKNAIQTYLDHCFDNDVTGRE